MNIDRSLLSRRNMLQRASAGVGTIGLANLLGSGQARAGSVASNAHLAARAKNVIFLFMNGGPSQFDTFDPKPALEKYAGQKSPAMPGRTVPPRFLPSPFRFTKCGQSGIEVSETLPRIAEVIDDVCVIRSMQADSPNHEPAILQMHTGHLQPTRPSFGSWLTYGLGTENQNLPGYVVLRPRDGIAVGPALWSSAFLPGQFQGASFITRDMAVDKLIKNLRSPRWSRTDQRGQLDLLSRLNALYDRQSGADDRLNAEIEAMETAFRMQKTALRDLDISQEPSSVRKLYGQSSFGQSVLLARRLVEAGVRVITVYYTGEGRQPWDTHQQHNRLHQELCTDADRATAALIRDLKSRGMLEETLVIWGGEFGRTPYGEYREDPAMVGRDHHHQGFTMLLAGGGVRGGRVYGSTDELGMQVAEHPVHVHDLHATILHLMGIDHTQLTYRYAGRDFRLTDVYGKVIREIIA